MVYLRARMRGVVAQSHTQGFIPEENVGTGGQHRCQRNHLAR